MGEKKQIRISVKDKIACLVDKEQFLVCGNNDYEVVFDFDSDWEGISAKTAVFVYGNTPVHKPFVGNVCEGIEIKNATLCAIGVFAGDIKTTTGATIECRQSIRDIGGVPKPPSKEVYDEIMALLDKAISGGGGGSVDLTEIEKKIEVIEANIEKNSQDISKKVSKTEFNSGILEAKEYAETLVTPISERQTALEERVTDLETLTLTFTEDTSTDYEKAVPAEVGKYALVKMIGGATEKVYSKNILNPRNMRFYTGGANADITLEYNNDGSITYTFVDYGYYCSFGLVDFPVGKYYLYSENASLVSNDEGYIDLALDSDYAGGDEIPETTRTMKIMVWRDESVTTEAYEIVEAPEGTVFEPYHEPYFQDAEVERIESIGANLIPFPYDNGTKGAGYTETQNGITWTVNEDGSVTANGTATANTYIYLARKLQLSVSSYYLSGTPTVSNNTYINSFIKESDGTSVATKNDVGKGNSFTIADDSYYMDIRIYIGSGNTANNLIFKPMISRGTTAVPYKPYSAEPIGSIAIPFEAIKAKIDGFGKSVNNTYYDYIEFVDDKVFGYKVADEIVLNGTEEWRSNGAITSTTNRFITLATSDKTKYVSGQISSDRYDRFSLTNNDTDIGINAYVSSAFGGFVIAVRPIDVTSYNPASFKESVKANPITVRLALATPEVTDITDLFTEGNKLQVQQGGAIRFVNERKMAIPNTVAFIKRKE